MTHPAAAPAHVPVPGRSAARSIALFAVVATFVAAILGGSLALFFSDAASRRAVLVSAALALVVQLLVFVGLRLAPREHVIAAWGLGTLARFGILAIYAFVVVRALALPTATALVSFVGCLFALTLLEPPFLKS